MSLLNYTGPIASRGFSYHGRGENKIGLLDRDLLLFGLDSMEFFFFELRICIEDLYIRWRWREDSKINGLLINNFYDPNLLLVSKIIRLE